MSSAPTASSSPELDGPRRVRRWALGDWAMAARALVVAVLAPLLVRLPLDRLARLLEPRRPAEHDVDTPAGARVLHVADVVLSRGRPLVRPGCQTRGLTRYHCLRRAGFAAELCFGVGRIDGQVVSHCWVLADGNPVREPDDLAAFTELFRLSAGRVIQVAAS